MRSAQPRGVCCRPFGRHHGPLQSVAGRRRSARALSPCSHHPRSRQRACARLGRVALSAPQCPAKAIWRGAWHRDRRCIPEARLQGARTPLRSTDRPGDAPIPVRAPGPRRHGRLGGAPARLARRRSPSRSRKHRRAGSIRHFSGLPSYRKLRTSFPGCCRTPRPSILKCRTTLGGMNLATATTSPT